MSELRGECLEALAGELRRHFPDAITTRWCESREDCGVWLYGVDYTWPGGGYLLLRARESGLLVLTGCGMEDGPVGRLRYSDPGLVPEVLRLAALVCKC